MVAGIAGLFAGSMSMAVGEFVSVSSQRDAERADIEREKEELAAIYEKMCLVRSASTQVP